MKLVKVLIIFSLAFFYSAPLFAATDKGKSAWWLGQYKEVNKGDFYKRAQGIFQKVLSAADRRRGVNPRLYIIEYDGLPWAQSLEDGSIILTRKAVEFCLKGRERESGEAKLAFVIGHELAHQMNADFWPYRFSVSAGNNPELGGVKEFAASPSAIKAVELQADQYGIIYSALAGYRTDVIASGGTNFFKEWFRAIDPTLGSLGPEDPTIAQRTLAVTMMLKEVSSRIEFFNAAVIASHIGWYREAVALFSEFLNYYPGREVYHNIGTAYLMLAMKHYRESRGTKAIPFHLSIEADAATRAESTEAAFNEAWKNDKMYADQLAKAIEYLKKAADSDPDYVSAKVNLGAAYILEERYFNSISEFEDALKIDPKNVGAMNNLAVAQYLIGESMRDDIFKERAYNGLKKLASGCSPEYRANFVRIGRMLGRSEDYGSMLPEEMEEIVLPDLGLAARLGNRLDKNELRMIGELQDGKGSKLAIFAGPSNNELIFTRNGVARMVYRRGVKIVPKVKTNCGSGRIVNSAKRGINLASDIYFVYQ